MSHSPIVCSLYRLQILQSFDSATPSSDVPDADEFLGFYIRTPSEHSIGGQQFSIEFQFVYYNSNDTSASCSPADQLSRSPEPQRSPSLQFLRSWPTTTASPPAFRSSTTRLAAPSLTTCV